MKYFSLRQINEAITGLEKVHPFFLITFFAAKKHGLAVGYEEEVALDAITKGFLRKNFKLHPKSQYFFKPFKGANKQKVWVTPKYPSSGLQAINTQTFRDAFIHSPRSNSWGWSSSYVEVLSDYLKERGKVDLFAIVVWINRNIPIPEKLTRQEVLNSFINEFGITAHEIDAIFDVNISSNLSENDAFQISPVGWEEIVLPYPMPPDIGVEAEAFLSLLVLNSLGPSPSLEFHPASRLNLLTGDNGIGKTFLLDAVWLAVTKDWVEHEIVPRHSETSSPPSITFQYEDTTPSSPYQFIYDRKSGWKQPTSSPQSKSLVLYSRSDGAFAAWDPLRRSFSSFNKKIVLDRNDVWLGKNSLIEGLLRDLSSWFNLGSSNVLDLFIRTLSRLSPPEMPPLQLGAPIRIRNYSQQIPTLKHVYGDVPLIFESAGIKRIVALAYLIVWAWNEHKTLALDDGKKPAKRLVLLIDELEAHLHPKWQRTVLPALLGVLSDLSSDLDSQVFVATHSPLVAASMEGSFQSESDGLFNLDIGRDGLAYFRQLDYAPKGAIDAWLTSPAFGLEEPRSIESSEALRMAIALQKQETPDAAEVAAVHSRLIRLLPPSDRFWSRWLLFAKHNGALK